MSFFRKIFFLLACFGLTCFGLTGTAIFVQAGEPLTIKKAVAEAMAANPRLQSFAAQVDAAKARIGMARSLDDPRAEVEFDMVPINTTDITQGASTDYMVSQKLPFPTKLAARGKAAKQSYGAQKNIYQALQIDLLAAVEHAFHHLYLVEGTLRINRELQNLFQGLEVSEKARYATGNQTSQNFLKAKVELEKLKSEAELLEARRIEALARLNILRNKDPKEEVWLAELPRLDHSHLAYAALEKRFLEINPDLGASRFQVEAAKATASLAKQEAWIPDLEARFGYNQRYGQVDAWTGAAMINIPFLWGKNRKAAKEAKALAQSANHAYRNLQNEGLAMLQETYARLESRQRSHQLFEGRILPSVKLALQSAEAAYQTGKDDFLSWIDAAREFKEAKLGALEAKIDYHRAMTDLKMAVGEDWTVDHGPWTKDR